MLAAWLVPAALLATSAPVPAASVVGAVAVRGGRGGEVVTVRLTGGVPKYTVLGAGTTEVAVVFDGTTVDATVPPSIAGVGPLGSVSVAQTGISASVVLHLAAAAPVRPHLLGGGVVALEIGAPAAAAPPGAAETGLAAAFRTPAAPLLGSVTEVVPLKYADVSEIAGVLVQGVSVASNDTFAPVNTNFGTQTSSGTFGGGTSGLSTGATQGAAVDFTGAGNALAQRLNDSLAIDRRLNAVVLTGTPAEVARLRELVARLDVPLRSVILETEVVELTESAARNVGIDYSPQGFIAQGSFKPATLSTAQAQASFQANLYGAISHGGGRILAKPQILAQSGFPASILTGDALPIITTVIVGGASAVTSQQVNYVNVGVNLQIQPRISGDGFVTSHIFAEVSSVTAFTQGIPQISQRQAVTTATVRDGASFVIGGLLQDNEIHNLTKIPILGNLPILGPFFRFESMSHQKTNLYIIVTPRVVAENPPTARTPVVPSAQGPVPSGTRP